ILFSNVGAIFYPEAVTGVIVPILVYRNLEGAWPNLGTQIEGSGFTADVRFAGPLLVLTVTESELKQYEIFLDSNLMASVRDGTEELLQRYVALLQGRKPFDVFPVFPATL